MNQSLADLKLAPAICDASGANQQKGRRSVQFLTGPTQFRQRRSVQFLTGFTVQTAAICTVPHWFLTVQTVAIRTVPHWFLTVQTAAIRTASSSLVPHSPDSGHLYSPDSSGPHSSSLVPRSPDSSDPYSSSLAPHSPDSSDPYSSSLFPHSPDNGRGSLGKLSALQDHRTTERLTLKERCLHRPRLMQFKSDTDIHNL